jgi:hypothetical protein
MIMLSGRPNDGRWPWLKESIQDYPAFKGEVGELSRSYQDLTHHIHKELVQLFTENCMDKKTANYIWRIKTMSAC